VLSVVSTARPGLFFRGSWEVFSTHEKYKWGCDPTRSPPLEVGRCWETTVTNRVAERLPALGSAVIHLRGSLRLLDHASHPRLRLNVSNLDLAPQADF
jgi:hypothetical protein